MDSTLLTAFSGVLGSLVGGGATLATAWLTQKAGGRKELLREEIKKREQLYGRFISECSRRLVDSLSHSLEEPETLLSLYELTNRIRLVSSPPVLAEAERLLALITDQYFSRNLSVEEMRKLALSENADPLRRFGQACRRELDSLRGNL